MKNFGFLELFVYHTFNRRQLFFIWKIFQGHIVKLEVIGSEGNAELFGTELIRNKREYDKNIIIQYNMIIILMYY